MKSKTPAPSKSKPVRQTRPRQPGSPFSLQQAADFLGVSRWHLGRLARKGEVKHTKLGTRILFPEAVILQLANGTASARSQPTASQAIHQRKEKK